MSSAWLPPSWFNRTAWVTHRALYSATGGRRGLRTPTDGRWGMLLLLRTRGTPLLGQPAQRHGHRHPGATHGRSITLGRTAAGGWPLQRMYERDRLAAWWGVGSQLVQEIDARQAGRGLSNGPRLGRLVHHMQRRGRSRPARRPTRSPLASYPTGHPR